MSTQFIITIGDPGEGFPDSSRILTERSDAVRGKKTESCKEQAQFGWSTLVNEEISDRLLRRMNLVSKDCAVHHNEKWSLERRGLRIAKIEPRRSS